MASVDLKDLFQMSVPDGFLPAVSRGVDWVYNTAFRRCSMLPDDQAFNLRPFYRWCLLDVKLLRIAAKFRAKGVTATSLPNDGGCYYVQVSSGKVLLTASSVESSHKVPRKAVFRETLARDNRPWLFPELEDPPPPDEAPLYAILIHAPHPENPLAPWFANIRFPLPDCKSWAPEKIELLTSYPSAGRAKRTFEEERIEDQVLGQLREDAKKNTGKSDSV